LVVNDILFCGSRECSRWCRWRHEHEEQTLDSIFLAKYSVQTTSSVQSMKIPLKPYLGAKFEIQTRSAKIHMKITNLICIYGFKPCSTLQLVIVVWWLMIYIIIIYYYYNILWSSFVYATKMFLYLPIMYASFCQLGLQRR